MKDSSKNDQTQRKIITTIRETSEILGLSHWKLYQAAKSGIFPTYTLLNSRKLVCLSEIIDAITSTKERGNNE